MEADGVVPDVLDEAPPAKLEVTYPGGVQVEMGAELTPLQVKDEPTVKWDAHPEKYYLLSMVDPDAPSRENPTYREINHWLVVNIKGGDVSTGEVLTGYRGSGPRKGSGLHRYVFLIFEQKDKLAFDDVLKIPSTFIENRAKFSIRDFAKKYNLGKALLGNFYNAQWDPYVDERRKNRS